MSVGSVLGGAVGHAVAPTIQQMVEPLYPVVGPAAPQSPAGRLDGAYHGYVAELRQQREGPPVGLYVLGGAAALVGGLVLGSQIRASLRPRPKATP